MTHEYRPLAEVFMPDALDGLVGPPVADRRAAAPPPYSREWLRMPPTEAVAALTDLVNKTSATMRTALNHKIDVTLDGLPAGAFVAVSPPDFGDPRDGVVTVSYTIKPLLRGMPVPNGWTAYGRR